MQVFSPRLLPELSRFLKTVAIFAAVTAAFFATPFAARAADSDETEIEIKAMPGLKYDTPRFKVAPGAKVKLALENADDMAHNLVITAPGARIAVATAALTMPVTPTQTFIPKTDKVLFHTSVLTPGKSETIEFTASVKEGVYPYVCTFPGHGFVMFGAMYVTAKEMPALASDPNIPPGAKDLPEGATGSKAAPLHAFTPKPPYLYRIFMRDCGPAAIAVALPNAQNYCWDAGACRLRYAWKGAFVDPSPHWKANGDAFAEVKGRIYWRAGNAFPLRLGDVKKIPQIQFRGYRLIDRFPEFHYEINGIDVHELIKPLPGGNGLVSHFAIANAGHPIFYVVNPHGGAKFTTSVGEFQNGVLELTPEEAGDFTITLTEIPKKEPLLYFSMNDVLPNKVGATTPIAVKGRAVKFDGKKAQLKMDIKASDLKQGATIEFWTMVNKPDGKDRVVLGAGGTNGQFTIGYSADGKNFGVTSQSSSVMTTASAANVEATASAAATNIFTDKIADREWHHVAVVLTPKATALFIDSEKQGDAGACALPDAALTLGALDGKQFFSGALDELRIFDRVLSEKEIHAIYESERPKTSKTAEAK